LLKRDNIVVNIVSVLRDLDSAKRTDLIPVEQIFEFLETRDSSEWGFLFAQVNPQSWRLLIAAASKKLKHFKTVPRFALFYFRQAQGPVDQRLCLSLISRLLRNGLSLTDLYKTILPSLPDTIRTHTTHALRSRFPIGAVLSHRRLSYPRKRDFGVVIRLKLSGAPILLRIQGSSSLLELYCRMMDRYGHVTDGFVLVAEGEEEGGREELVLPDPKRSVAEYNERVLRIVTEPDQVTIQRVIDFLISTE
jgi:hypothetical protein